VEREPGAGNQLAALLRTLGGTYRGQEGRLAPQWPAQDSFYAAQLRRAAPVVHLFAAAAPGGEKEAAYHALVRLAAAANASLGTLPQGAAPITPGTLYRDLAQQGAQRWQMPGGSAGALAFDTRVCAELDRRDANEP